MPIFNGLWVIVLKIFKLLWMIEINTFHTTHAVATQVRKTSMLTKMCVLFTFSVPRRHHEEATFAMKGRLLIVNIIKVVC